MEEGFGLAAELAADAWFECGWQGVHVGLVLLPNIFLLSACFLFGGINASDLVTKYIFITFV